jgi:hypothetical protein
MRRDKVTACLVSVEMRVANDQERRKPSSAHR